jgi:hypothetical protein
VNLDLSSKVLLLFDTTSCRQVLLVLLFLLSGCAPAANKLFTMSTNSNLLKVG